MTEPTVSVARAPEPEADTPDGAGLTLRRAREAAGMHPETLAATLKIPVWKLEAIEADRWDLLPDAVFARALAASICRTLKVDSAQVLGRLPLVKPRLLAEDPGINAPFRGASGVNSGGATLFNLSRPLLLAVVALFLGALILVLMPSSPPLSQKQGSAPVEDEKKQDAPSPAPVKQAAPEVPSAPESAASAYPSGAMPSGGAVPQLPSLPVSSPSPTDVPAGAMKAEVGQQARMSETAILFRTTGPSWIQVTDARGTVVLRKLMEAGESATATGVFPLAVLVGRVDATTVEVGGKPFDMTAISRENVARFEVKQ
jgi:cytoskeleton protein RodZ